MRSAKFKRATRSRGYRPSSSPQNLSLAKLTLLGVLGALVLGASRVCRLPWGHQGLGVSLRTGTEIAGLVESVQYGSVVTGSTEGSGLRVDGAAST
jgi:hypothetical protein